MARRIDAATGGFSLSSQARTPFDQADVNLPMVTLNAKCLTRNIGPMFSIVEELLAEALFSNEPRLKQLLGEYLAGLERMVVQNGHRLAISLSSRGFTPTNALSESWNGVLQIHTIRNFVQDKKASKHKDLAAILDAITRSLFISRNVIMATIGDKQQIATALSAIQNSRVLSAFERDPQIPTMPPLVQKGFKQQRLFEGWHTSSAVAFVAQTVPTVTLGHPDAPALAVLSKMLRSLYLHREIREKGGAYGGFALYNPENGLFSLASYRDPHVVRTLKIYSDAAGYLKNTPVSDEDLKEAILQVCSEIDKPDPPGPLAKKAFSRLIIGLDDEIRLNFKQKLLRLSKDQVLAAAEKYLQDVEQRAGVAVIGSMEQLDRANKQLGTKPLTIAKI
jgi:hypothetical protein